MAEAKGSVEVRAPLRTVYNQWTQFEEFPSFMKGVESVRQLDDSHLHWTAELGGRRHEWDAEISHQEPDRRIAWRAVDGKYNSGEVTFEPLAPERTRVNVSMIYDTEGIVESIGSAVGADDRRVKGDLERFKHLIEAREVETGAWRGDVRKGEVVQSASTERNAEREATSAEPAASSVRAEAGGVARASTVEGEAAERAPLLSPEEAEGMRERWHGLQMRFVDEPRQMVEEADDLVNELMQRLTSGFNDKRSRLEGQWAEGEQASTEDLRVALTRYRSFFNRLLSA